MPDYYYGRKDMAFTMGPLVVLGVTLGFGGIPQSRIFGALAFTVCFC